ncbi:hypothetical protein ACM61V_14075 [Sphingomonas sp. TX0543]|uniref:hypothetical protein n=1 Tax=unclassified Sphingomonas TaxID=196159 RepID=UPI0014851DC0|nr:hypothetical protein [Sphingomonas sp. 3P27F8]
MRIAIHDHCDPATLDGLGQIAAMVTTSQRPPIGETMRFSLVAFDRGHAVFEGAPDRSV